jgi:hypothetical protein
MTRRPHLDDQTWLSRVAHLLSPDLIREYLNRMRLVRLNARMHEWRGERRTGRACA